MITALNITPKGLPPLGSPHQHRARDFRGVRSPDYAPGPRAMVRAGAIRLVWDEIAAIGLLLRVALAEDCDREKCVQQIIYLGGPRKHGPRPLLVPRLALLAVCILAPRLAYAQAVEPKVITPVDLFLPEASPGVRIAPALVLKPGIDATVLHDTNIYNQATNARSDTLAIVRPGLQLATDWSRHQLKLDATADLRRYFRTPNENSEQWQIGGLASLDLANRTKFEVSAEIARRIELRGTAGDAFNTDRPVHFLEKRVAAQIARTGGRLELIGGGSLSRLNYGDASLNAVTIDLSGRDVVLRQAHVRANYRLGPKLGLFADLSGNQVDYVTNPGTSRNSSGYGVLAGLHYQVSALLDAEVAAGHIRQSFKDPLLRPVSGINYAVTLNWTPTPRWKITAAGHRSIEPGPLANVPAIVRSNFDLKVQRAVSDQVLIEFGSGFVRESYRGLARNDNRYFGQVAVSYRLSSRLLASVLGGYRKQNSTEPGRSYDGFSAGLTLGLKL
ncbi:MAG: outer membrane beta-barrel protein [Novosphingobium sp.]